MKRSIHRPAFKKMSYVGIHSFGQQLKRGTAAVALLTSSACIVVTPGSPDPDPVPVNYEPVIYDAYVYCDYDYYYLDYYWDILAQVDDVDGDVVDVYADVYDYYTGSYLETQPLAYDGGDQWSNRIYELYSDYLTCVYAEDFDFEIYAVDSYGAYDVATVAYVP